MKKKMVQLLSALILIVAAFASQAEAGGPFCPIDHLCALACHDNCIIQVCGASYPNCTAPGMHEAIGACAEACARPGCCI